MHSCRCLRPLDRFDWGRGRHPGRHVEATSLDVESRRVEWATIDASSADVVHVEATSLDVEQVEL